LLLYPAFNLNERFTRYIDKGSKPKYAQLNGGSRFKKHCGVASRSLIDFLMKIFAVYEAYHGAAMLMLCELRKKHLFCAQFITLEFS
jgi:hypothetical protein